MCPLQSTKFSLEMFGAFFLADVSCKNNYRILIKTLTLSCHFRVRVCFSSVTIYDNGENRIFFQWTVFTKSSWVIAPGKIVVYCCANSKPILCLMLYVAVSPRYVWYSVRMQWVMLIKSKTRFLLELVITKGYGMRATTMSFA